ncbi:unnamed protein product [Lactuca virosa]|uniref:Uncharacterized protein n=1 Tax=Lactuca virosa TaxID=75947 RepID=A0AAU9M5J8_9ASTR|nr:unnamed protein product [Lactuca virosa]
MMWATSQPHAVGQSLDKEEAEMELDTHSPGLMRIFSRIAQEDFQYHSDSFFSALELHPLPYKFDEDMVYEIYSSTDIVDEDDQDFVPRLVHLELVKGASGSHEDYDPSFSSCWTNQGCQQEWNRRICS